MAKIMPRCQLVRFHVGPAAPDKANGYYAHYAHAIAPFIADFIKFSTQEERPVAGMARGKIIEEKIETGLSAAKQRLMAAQEAVQ